MTYAEFLTHMRTFSWRVNDPDFDASLPTIIKMAEARLSRDLKIRQSSTTITLTSNVGALPSDYGQMIAVLIGGKTPATPITRFRFNELLSANNGMYNHPVYYIPNKDTVNFITTASADNPLDVDLHYYVTVPDFSAEGQSWVADEYLDIYSYAVLTYGGDFLKDSSDAAVFESRYIKGLESLTYHKATQEFSGSPLQSYLPGIVR